VWLSQTIFHRSAGFSIPHNVHQVHNVHSRPASDFQAPRRVCNPAEPRKTRSRSCRNGMVSTARVRETARRALRQRLEAKLKKDPPRRCGRCMRGSASPRLSCMASSRRFTAPSRRDAMRSGGTREIGICKSPTMKLTVPPKPPTRWRPAAAGWLAASSRLNLLQGL
jgi:hypothetical protein